MDLHDIYALWPSRRDVAAILGRSEVYVQNMLRPSRLPPAKYDLVLYRDALRRGLPVTLDDFVTARCKAEGIIANLPSQEAAE